jgi:hypothetical protein
MKPYWKVILRFVDEHKRTHNKVHQYKSKQVAEAKALAYRYMYGDVAKVTLRKVEA